MRRFTGRARALIFCDCDEVPAVLARFQAKGASTAVARQFGIPGHIVVAGNGAALTAAHRIARELKLKAVEILPGATDLFDAAVTLGTAAITPLIDCAAALLREAGIRDGEAARIASALFSQTAQRICAFGQAELGMVHAQAAKWSGSKPRSPPWGSVPGLYCGSCCCLGSRLSTSTRMWRGVFSIRGSGRLLVSASRL